MRPFRLTRLPRPARFLLLPDEPLSGLGARLGEPGFPLVGDGAEARFPHEKSPVENECPSGSVKLWPSGYMLAWWYGGEPSLNVFRLFATSSLK